MEPPSRLGEYAMKITRTMYLLAAIALAPPAMAADASYEEITGARMGNAAVPAPPAGSKTSPDAHCNCSCRHAPAQDEKNEKAS